MWWPASLVDREETGDIFEVGFDETEGSKRSWEFKQWLVENLTAKAMRAITSFPGLSGVNCSHTPLLYVLDKSS